MAKLGKFALFCVAAVTATMLCSCAFPIRVGYNRKSGSYKHIPQASDIAYTGEDTVSVANSLQNESSSSASQNVQAASAADSLAAKTTAKDSAKTIVAATSSATSATSATSAASATAAASAALPNTAKKEKAVAEKSKQQPRRRGSLEDYARKWLGARYVYGAASTNKTDCSGYVMQVYKGFYNIALDHNASKMFKDTRGKSVRRGSLKEGDLVFFGGFWRIDHVGIYLKGDRFIHASSSKGVMISPMDDIYWSPKYKGAKRFR